MSLKSVTEFAELFTTRNRNSTQRGKPADHNFEKLLNITIDRPDGTSAQQARIMAETARLRMMAGLFTDDPNGTEKAILPGFEGFQAIAATQVHTYKENAGQAILNRHSADTMANTIHAKPAQGEKELSLSRTAETGSEIDLHINRAAQKYGVAPELVRAVIQAESSFNPQAVSPAGAQGLMQLMPATAQELGVDDPFDPSQNIMGGTRYLRSLLDRYDGDLNKALAAYNWGMGNLDRSTGELPAETRNYQSRVHQYLAHFNQENHRA